MGDGGRGEGAAGGLYRTGEEAGGLGLEERRESEGLRIIHLLPSGKILRDGENRKRGSWNAYDKAGGGLLGLKETNNNGAVGRWEREVGELPPHREEQSIYKDVLMKPTVLYSWFFFFLNTKLIE